jgi:putative transposase
LVVRDMGLAGARRGKKVITTRPDPTASRAADLVKRRFLPLAPNRLWVADFTYVSTWSGPVYVAFVIDAYARRILGWRAATNMTTDLVLDTIEQAIWTRAREGITDLGGLVHHNHAGSQYTSIAFTERLAEHDVDASVGAVSSYSKLILRMLSVMRSCVPTDRGARRREAFAPPGVSSWPRT